MYFPGIEAFLAILQIGSLTKAGDMLNLTQATISYRLKTLGKLMDKPLSSLHKISRLHMKGGSAYDYIGDVSF